MSSFHRGVCVVPLLLGAGVFAQSADPAGAGESAQPAAGLAEATTPRIGQFWQIDAGARGMFSADGKRAGDLRTLRAHAGLSFNTPIADDLRLRLSFHTQQAWYDFDGVTTVAPGTDDPWDHLQAHRLGGMLFARVNDQWSWFGGLEVRAAHESGADLDDSLELRGLGGAEYTVSDRLKLTLGVAATTQLEDDPLVIPILGVNWTIDERTTLATRELGLVLSREIAESWHVGVFGAFEYQDWRLDDSRATVPGGVARDKRGVFGVEARYRPSNSFEFAAEAGVIAWQKVKALNDDGRKVGEERFDPAAFLGLSVLVRF